jgi:hypothetical protein
MALGLEERQKRGTDLGGFHRLTTLSARGIAASVYGLDPIDRNDTRIA